METKHRKKNAARAGAPPPPRPPPPGLLREDLKNHNNRKTANVCRHFLVGKCFMNPCRFLHPTDADRLLPHEDPGAATNEAGDMVCEEAQDERKCSVCVHFLGNKCVAGNNCRFPHIKNVDITHYKAALDEGWDFGAWFLMVHDERRSIESRAVCAALERDMLVAMANRPEGEEEQDPRSARAQMYASLLHTQQWAEWHQSKAGSGKAASSTSWEPSSYPVPGSHSTIYPPADSINSVGGYRNANANLQHASSNHLKYGGGAGGSLTHDCYTDHRRLPPQQQQPRPLANGANAYAQQGLPPSALRAERAPAAEAQTAPQHQGASAGHPRAVQNENSLAPPAGAGTTMTNTNIAGLDSASLEAIAGMTTSADGTTQGTVEFQKSLINLLVGEIGRLRAASHQSHQSHQSLPRQADEPPQEAGAARGSEEPQGSRANDRDPYQYPHHPRRSNNANVPLGASTNGITTSAVPLSEETFRGNVSAMIGPARPALQQGAASAFPHMTSEQRPINFFHVNYPVAAAEAAGGSMNRPSLDPFVAERTRPSVGVTWNLPSPGELWNMFDFSEWFVRLLSQSAKFTATDWGLWNVFVSCFMMQNSARRQQAALRMFEDFVHTMERRPLILSIYFDEALLRPRPLLQDSKMPAYVPSAEPFAAENRLVAGAVGGTVGGNNAAGRDKRGGAVGGKSPTKAGGGVGGGGGGGAPRVKEGEREAEIRLEKARVEFSDEKEAEKWFQFEYSDGYGKVGAVARQLFDCADEMAGQTLGRITEEREPSEASASGLLQQENGARGEASSESRVWDHRMTGSTATSARPQQHAQHSKRPEKFYNSMELASHFKKAWSSLDPDDKMKMLGETKKLGDGSAAVETRGYRAPPGLSMPELELPVATSFSDSAHDAEADSPLRQGMGMVPDNHGAKTSPAGFSSGAPVPLLQLSASPSDPPSPASPDTTNQERTFDSPVTEILSYEESVEQKHLRRVFMNRGLRSNYRRATNQNLIVGFGERWSKICGIRREYDFSTQNGLEDSQDVRHLSITKMMRSTIGSFKLWRPFWTPEGRSCAEEVQCEIDAILAADSLSLAGGEKRKKQKLGLVLGDPNHSPSSEDFAAGPVLPPKTLLRPSPIVSEKSREDASRVTGCKAFVNRPLGGGASGTVGGVLGGPLHNRGPAPFPQQPTFNKPLQGDHASTMSTTCTSGATTGPHSSQTDSSSWSGSLSNSENGESRKEGRALPRLAVRGDEQDDEDIVCCGSEPVAEDIAHDQIQKSPSNRLLSAFVTCAREADPQNYSMPQTSVPVRARPPVTPVDDRVAPDLPSEPAHPKVSRLQLGLHPETGKPLRDHDFAAASSCDEVGVGEEEFGRGSSGNRMLIGNNKNTPCRTSRHSVSARQQEPAAEAPVDYSKTVLTSSAVEQVPKENVKFYEQETVVDPRFDFERRYGLGPSFGPGGALAVVLEEEEEPPLPSSFGTFCDSAHDHQADNYREMAGKGSHSNKPWMCPSAPRSHAASTSSPRGSPACKPGNGLCFCGCRLPLVPDALDGWRGADGEPLKIEERLRMFMKADNVISPAHFGGKWATDPTRNLPPHLRDKLSQQSFDERAVRDASLDVTFMVSSCEMFTVPCPCGVGHHPLVTISNLECILDRRTGRTIHYSA